MQGDGSAAALHLSQLNVFDLPACVGRIDNILINYPTGQRFRCPCPVKSGVDHVIVQQVFSKKAFTVCCFLAFISTHEIDFPDHSQFRAVIPVQIPAAVDQVKILSRYMKFKYTGAVIPAIP